MREAEQSLVELVKLRRALRTGEAVGVRERAGLTQGEVAGALGVSRSAVSLWESGSRSPKGSAALRYARLLVALAASVGDEVASA